MTRRLLILLCPFLLLSYVSFGQQLGISPAASTPVCPNTTMVYTIQGENGNNLQLQSYSGFNSINAGIDNDNNMVITANVQDAAASFVIYDFVTSSAQSFNLNVSTLVNVTPKFNPASPRATGSYADTVAVPLCSTTAFSYNGPMVFYQYSGQNSGTGMTNYQWQVPSGWAVNGTVSNGTTPIAGGTNVTITPNATTGGVLQFWALNNCNPNLQPSKKMQVKLSRTISAGINVNGSGTTTVQCGVPNPVTFNVTGASGDCITGYQWNAPSGWLDASGNALNNPFTTTTPYVTLTPQQFTQPSNVSVTLMVNGSPAAADTYTETVLYNNTPQPTTLSGPTPACGTGPFTYTVNGLPAGSSPTTFTVTNVSLTGTINQSSSGNTLTITDPDAAAYGTISISATTQTPCGVAVTPTMNVYIGQPTPIITGFINGESLVGPGPFTFTMRPLTLQPITGYQWTVAPHATISGQNTQTVTFTTPHLNAGQSGDVYIWLQYQTACGGWSQSNEYYFVDKGSGTGGFSIQPQSGMNQAAIIINNKPNADGAQSGASVLPEVQTVRSVVVTNAVGQVLKKVTYGGQNSTEYLDTHDLATGIYFVQVTSNKGVIGTQKLFISR